MSAKTKKYSRRIRGLSTCLFAPGPCPRLIEEVGPPLLPEGSDAVDPASLDLSERRARDDPLADARGPRDHVEGQLVEDVLVGWLLPPELVGPQLVDRLQTRDAGEHRLERR